MAVTLYSLPISSERERMGGYLDDAFVKSRESTVYLDEETTVLLHVIGENLWSDKPLIYLTHLVSVDKDGDEIVEQCTIKVRHLEDEESDEFGNDFALCLDIKYTSEYGKEELTPLIADLLPLTLNQLASQLELNGEKALVRIKLVRPRAEGESRFITMLERIPQMRYDAKRGGQSETHLIYISADLDENRS